MSRVGIGVSQRALESLKCEEHCCVCGAKINLISELYEPFPLFEDDEASEKSCCYACFNEVVVPARILLLQRRFHQDQVWTGFTFTEEDGDMNIPLIDLKQRTHHYKEAGVTACGLEVARKGRHLATRRNGSVTNVNCPECRKLLEEMRSENMPE